MVSDGKTLLFDLLPLTKEGHMARRPLRKAWNGSVMVEESDWLSDGYIALRRVLIPSYDDAYLQSKRRKDWFYRESATDERVLQCIAPTGTQHELVDPTLLTVQSEDTQVPDHILVYRFKVENPIDESRSVVVLDAYRAALVHRLLPIKRITTDRSNLPYRMYTVLLWYGDQQIGAIMPMREQHDIARAVREAGLQYSDM